MSKPNQTSRGKIELVARAVDGTDKLIMKMAAEFEISVGRYPKCGICNRPIKSYGEFNIDHIHPRSKGGKDVWDNLQLAHKRCNSLKGNKVAPPRQEVDKKGTLD